MGLRFACMSMVLVGNINSRCVICQPRRQITHMGCCVKNRSWERVYKLVWLRARCHWLKLVLISSRGWCKACRARLNASNPGCFTENNPGTAASAPGSCAGAGFKETAGPKLSPKPSSCLQSVNSGAPADMQLKSMCVSVCGKLRKENPLIHIRGFSWFRWDIPISVIFPRDNKSKSAQNRKLDGWRVKSSTWTAKLATQTVAVNPIQINVYWWLWYILHF